ncbi:hypothetical protein SAMN04489726_1431 [Allokutzneria albata]|uniref:Uncharacterized protein n=1 Tax=Allokutzneria albata TaxID=211114 RepID=A0A1G9SYR8_ALLAB|nr:hypothetical protein SAMN04489726_1431 [Allokutzneria albata]
MRSEPTFVEQQRRAQAWRAPTRASPRPSRPCWTSSTRNRSSARAGLPGVPRLRARGDGSRAAPGDRRCRRPAGPRSGVRCARVPRRAGGAFRPRDKENAVSRVVLLTTGIHDDVAAGLRGALVCARSCSADGPRSTSAGRGSRSSGAGRGGPAVLGASVGGVPRGPSAPPAKRSRADRFANALVRAVEAPVYRDRAAAIADPLSSEDGAERVISALAAARPSPAAS